MSATIPKVEPVLSDDLFADRITPIGWQAYEIITSILEDPSPDLDPVKWRLRRCVAAYPGSPERALQAHLITTSVLVNAYSQEGPA